MRALCLVTAPAFLIAAERASAQTSCAMDLVRIECGSARAGPKGRKDWELDVTPYLWALGIKGTTGLADHTAHINITFKELLDHLKGFFMGSLEARYGRWALGMDLNYLKVEDRDPVPAQPFTEADFIARQSMFEIGPRYRVLRAKPAPVDLVAGVRWWSLGNTLKLSTNGQAEPDLKLNKDWVDPFVGARTVVDLSRRVSLLVYGDVGGFGINSKFAWQVIGAFGYTLNQHWSFRAGYRQVDVDHKEDSDDFMYDVGYLGPVFSATYRLW